VDEKLGIIDLSKTKRREAELTWSVKTFGKGLEGVPDIYDSTEVKLHVGKSDLYLRRESGGGVIGAKK